MNPKTLYPILIFLILLSNNSAAQQIIVWQNHYGGTSDDRADAMIQTPDGGFALLGFTSSNNTDVSDNNGGNDFWLVRTDDVGVLLWERNYGGAGLDEGRDIRNTPDGGFLLIGSSPSSNGDVGDNNGNYDIWVIKTNENGELEWETNLGGTDNDRGWSATPTPDGNYMAFGYSYSENGDMSDNNGSSDLWMIKLDTEGEILWERNFGGSGTDRARVIELTSDGGFILLSFTDSNDEDISGNNGGTDFWLVKTDENGILEWERNFGGSDNETARALQHTRDGGYILGGSSSSDDGDLTSNQGGRDVWLVKLTQSGDMEWQHSFGGPANDNLRKILQTEDDGFIIVGESASSSGDVGGNNGGIDFWVIKTDAQGSIEWEQNYGGSNDEYAFSVVATPHHGYVIAGYSRSDDGDVIGNYGLNDFWMLKIQDCVLPDLSNTIISRCADDQETNMATFDLNHYFDSLALANGLTLNWYENADGTIMLSNPDAFTTGSTQVFLQLELGPCLSQIWPVKLDVTEQPQDFIIEETICESELPFEVAGQFYNQSGNYIIESNTDEMGCEMTTILQLEVTDYNNLEAADAGPDQMVTEPNATLEANLPVGFTAFWTALDGGSILNPTRPTTDVKELLENTNSFVWTLEHPLCGIYDSDTMIINYQKEFFLPNIFTPNGDGDNDLFIIPGLTNNGSTAFHFSVFNRLGVLVYENSAYQNDWDGRGNDGDFLKEGTYYFVLKNGEGKNFAGWVKIVW